MKCDASGRFRILTDGVQPGTLKGVPKGTEVHGEVPEEPEVHGDAPQEPEAQAPEVCEEPQKPSASKKLTLNDVRVF